MYCKNIYCCGFFHKFHIRNHLVWSTMINDYCKDGKQECVRRMMFNGGNFKMSDDLLPVGVHATKNLLSLF